MEPANFLRQYPALLVILLTLVVAEGLWRRVHGGRYPWKQTGATFAVWVGQVASNALFRPLLAVVFMWAWQHRLFTIQLDAFGIVALFVVLEFQYYWFHRLSHRIRWLWATHSVHHSSETIVLSSAIRLGWTGALSGAWLFWLPLVFAGFHPAAVFAMLAANLLYQFFLHTGAVPRLGAIEKIFNTPANHRIHHSAEERHLDRNFGGVLIVFDRIFGTYFPEDATPARYGIPGHDISHNPLAIALGEWVSMARDFRAADNWRARMRTLISAP